MAKLLKSVEGLRVLVTGGCSGLGGATARLLSEAGARVLVVDIAAEQPPQPPTKAAAPILFRRADVTSEADVAAALAFAAAEFGGLDAAVNCAAVAFAARVYNWNRDSVLELADFSRMLHVNATGTFNVCRLAAQLMAKNSPQGGVLVNTSSISAFDGQNTQVAYSVSKAAITGMTLPMSRDLAPIGIRVCSIAPGYFDSPMCRGKTFPPRLVKFLADHNRAIYRLGRPAEFAQAVEAVLLNPMLNGVNIRLDGASRGFFYNRRKRAQPIVAAESAGAADGPVEASG